MFLQWKFRDIHQCHLGSLVLAAALLAVNNEIVKISFVFPSKQAGSEFILWFSAWINPFVYDQWDSVCFQKQSGFIPGRLSCWAVVVLERKQACSHTASDWITRQKRLLFSTWSLGFSHFDMKRCIILYLNQVTKHKLLKQRIFSRL